MIFTASCREPHGSLLWLLCGSLSSSLFLSNSCLFCGLRFLFRFDSGFFGCLRFLLGFYPCFFFCFSLSFLLGFNSCLFFRLGLSFLFSFKPCFLFSFGFCLFGHFVSYGDFYRVAVYIMVSSKE